VLEVGRRGVLLPLKGGGDGVYNSMALLDRKPKVSFHLFYFKESLGFFVLLFGQLVIILFLNSLTNTTSDTKMEDGVECMTVIFT
jgi:hypothetical protein